MKPLVFGLGIVAAFAALEGRSQSVKVAPPKQREAVITQAEELMASRGGPVVMPEKIVNPFVGHVQEQVVEAVEETAPLPQMSERDVLARLATQIVVSGTANMSGEAILLVGQKKLKVGDAIRINFEGESHELLITDIAATTFTVKRGNISYTRAIRPARR